MVPPPDSHFLSRCLRRIGNDDCRTELRRMDLESWRQLVDRAVWHGVAPLLYHRLGRFENVVIPPEPRERLRELHLHCLLANRAMLEQLSEIVRETSGAGFSILFLKGVYLANCVYEEPALRPMSDIDLLALPHEAEDVQVHLHTLGYRPRPWTAAIDYARLHHLRPISRRGSVDVEVHHDLAPVAAPFEHDIIGLFGRSTHTQVADLDLPHPAPDDVLLHVCTHAAYNDEFRLGLPAACDIDAVVHGLGQELDWGRLIATANADGRARFVYVALRLAGVLLETPVPESVLSSLHHDKMDDDVIEEAVSSALSMTDEVPSTLKSMGEAATASVKLKTLWQGLFPPPETLRRIYRLRPGTKMEFLYYVARPLDVVLRWWRQFLGLVVGSPRSRSALEKERHRRIIRAWARGEIPQG